MASIITNSFRLLQAKQFRDAFDPLGADTMYIGISKPSEWADELIPDSPVDSSQFNTLDLREWMAAKRLTTADVTQAVPRYNWSTGTVYAAYDDNDIDLFDKQFYVMTDEFKIYKCIRKPSASAQSTSKPTATPLTGFVDTADGYRWKYMMTVPAAAAARFLTTSWIPLSELTGDDSSGSNQWQVQQGATNGTIDYIVVTNGGSGYSVAPSVSIVGDGTGAAATATVVGGAVTAISVTGGEDYTWAEITISGVGSGATARAVISPKGGHGKNAVQELGAFFTVVNAVLNYNENNKFPKFNDYRKIFLIQNPTLFGSATIATDTVYSCVRKLTLSTTNGDFLPDEIVTGATSSATGIVVEYDSATKVVSVVGVSGTFTAGENITGGTSGVLGSSITTITDPELDPNGGAVVYKDYRRYVNRSEGQAESVIIAIGF